MVEPAQFNGQQQLNSPIQNGHPNGYAISQQKPSHDGLGAVSAVAIKDDEEQRSLKSLAHHLYSPSSSSSESSSSLKGENGGFVNGSQHLPTSNMQPVDVDSPGITTASNDTTSISAASVSSSPIVSPTTPTPSSVSLMFRQRLLDATSRQTSLEASLLESSNTPTLSKDVYSSGGASKDEGVDREGNQRGTKIIIPDPSTLVSLTDPNSNPPPSSIPNNTSLNSNFTPISSRPTSTTIDTTLFSYRPAPPSPALSRRVSGAPSTASSTHSSNSNSRPRSRSSMTRRPRMSGVGSDARRQSLGNQLNQFERSTASTATPILPSLPQPSSTPPPPARIYIKVRDFGFPPTDERHLGLGADIPKANRVHRLNRKLGGPDRATARAAAAAALDPSSSSAASASAVGNGRSKRTDSIGSLGSVDSSDADAEEEEEDGEEGWGIGLSGWGKGGFKGWEGFKLGMGRFSWNISSNHSNVRNGNEDSDKNKDKNSKGTTTSTMNGIFPTRKDLDMNFMDSSSSSSDDDVVDDERRGRRVADHGITEEFNDDDFDETVPHADDRDADDGEDEEYEEPQEPLYPGLYRALYAFEPEGMAEMELDEDQIVRVVGRGGGIGWAVVVDERGGDEVGGKVQVKHALVPEGYLEVVKLDWEDEEEGLENEEDGDGDGDGDAVVKAGDV